MAGRCTVVTVDGESFTGRDLKRSHSVMVAGKPMTIYECKTEDESARQSGTRFVRADEIKTRY